MHRNNWVCETNTAQAGLAKFVEHHRCYSICGAYNLPFPPGQRTDQDRAQNEEINYVVVHVKNGGHPNMAAPKNAPANFWNSSTGPARELRPQLRKPCNKGLEKRCDIVLADWNEVVKSLYLDECDCVVFSLIIIVDLVCMWFWPFVVFEWFDQMTSIFQYSKNAPASPDLFTHLLKESPTCCKHYSLFLTHLILSVTFLCSYVTSVFQQIIQDFSRSFHYITWRIPPSPSFSILRKRLLSCWSLYHLINTA